MKAARRIMIVEDEIFTGKILQTSLIYWGYDVCEVVRSGEESVKRAAHENPDVILMDVNLAGQMDGIEAATQIRSVCNTPIIFLTSNSDDDTKKRSESATPAAYLIKPAPIEEILSSIELALRRN
jgi:DNA-binding response OmpR family regulator